MPAGHTVSERHSGMWANDSEFEIEGESLASFDSPITPQLSSSPDAKESDRQSLEPRQATERLSTELPIDIRIPKTLRPTAQVVPARDEQGDQVRAVQSGARPNLETAGAMKNMARAGAESSVVDYDRPRNHAGVRDAESPMPKATDNVVTNPTSRERSEGKATTAPTDISPFSVDPRQPVSAIRLPSPAAENRAPQSRVSIGHLEVTVNNRPVVEPKRTATSQPVRETTEHLERRYLDRFRLRP